MKSALLNVSTKSSQWHVEYRDKTLLYLTRQDTFLVEKNIFDTFGPTWLLGLVESAPSTVSVDSGGDSCPLQNKQLIFVPPYSIIRWHVKTSVIKWRAFSSSAPLPEEAPTIPCLFDITTTPIPNTLLEIQNFLVQQKPVAMLRQERTDSSLAPQIKAYLDRHHKSEEKIESIALRFGVSRVTLSRHFSECYGISPLGYRQRLRIFSALHLISQGELITHSLFEGGFSCVSEFNRQVKNLLDLAPSKLSPEQSHPDHALKANS